MATATATAEVVPARTSRWTYLLAYLALVIVAEILIAVPGGATGQDRPLQPIGLAMHILLVFTLIFLSVLLQPKDPPLANFLVAVSLASLVRGILLKRAVEALDERYGLLYVTAIFASLHLYFLSATDMAFVFAVGLFYGFVVLNTKNLWGVILSHSLGNVILYLVAPFH